MWPALYDNFKCQASASSDYNKADNFYGPGNAVDGTLMPVDAVTDSVLTFSYYKADPSDPNPWLQLDCGSPFSIAMVMITALYDIEVKKVDIYVGDKFAVLGQQSEKQLCASTVNDIPQRSYQVIDCNNTVYGQIVQFQMQTPMSLHEVIVFPATKWHHSNVTLSIGKCLTQFDVTSLISFLSTCLDLKEKMVPRAQIASTASSIYEDYRSPTFLTDGILSASAIYFFHSDPSDPDPWIQMTVSQSWIITRLISLSRLVVLNYYESLRQLISLGLSLFKDWIAVQIDLSTFRFMLDCLVFRIARKILSAQNMKDHQRLEHKMC